MCYILGAEGVVQDSEQPGPLPAGHRCPLVARGTKARGNWASTCSLQLLLDSEGINNTKNKLISSISARLILEPLKLLAIRYSAPKVVTVLQWEQPCTREGETEANMWSAEILPFSLESRLLGDIAMEDKGKQKQGGRALGRRSLSPISTGRENREKAQTEARSREGKTYNPIAKSHCIQKIYPIIKNASSQQPPSPPALQSFYF